MTECLVCRKPLRRWIIGDGRGYNGDGIFCSLRCGYAWAVREVRTRL